MAEVTEHAHAVTHTHTHTYTYTHICTHIDTHTHTHTHTPHSHHHCHHPTPVKIRDSSRGKSTFVSMLCKGTKINTNKFGNRAQGGPAPFRPPCWATAVCSPMGA